MAGVSGSLEDSELSISVAKQNPSVFATVGVHPTRCSEEFEQGGDGEAHLAKLLALAKDGGNRVVAIGEIGLDYDREQFCPRDIQLKWFQKQLALAQETKLPVIFHNRNTGMYVCMYVCMGIWEWECIIARTHTYNGHASSLERKP